MTSKRGLGALSSAMSTRFVWNLLHSYLDSQVEVVHPVANTTPLKGSPLVLICMNDVV